MKLALWQKAAVAGCIGMVTLGVATPAVAGTGHTPFENVGSFSLIAQTQNGHAQLYKQDLSNTGSPAEAVGAPWSGNGTSTEYNAMGFNAADGYIYAVSGGYEDRASGVNDLLQVGSDGSVVNLGRISGLANNRFYNSGTIVDGKHLIVTSQGATAIYSIDLSTRVAEKITLTDKWVPADFAASVNPNVLWGVYQSSIQRLNMVTGQLDTFVNPLGSSAGGSMASAPNGDLIFTEDSGRVSQIHIEAPDSAAPRFTLVTSVTGPASSTADGTAIGERRDAHQPFDPRQPLGFLVPSAPGASQLYTVDVTRASSPATPVGSPWGGDGVTNQYNAIAFDKSSGYLYGVTRTENTLVQIGKDGSVVTIAPIRNPGGNTGTDFLNTGTILGGKLFATGTTLAWGLSIDLKTGQATQVSFDTTWKAADFASSDGRFLWGVHGKEIHRLELATGHIASFENTVTPKDAGIGGIMVATDGDFVVSDNSHGTSYRFRIANAESDNPTFTVVGTGTLPVTTDSDGASTLDAN